MKTYAYDYYKVSVPRDFNEKEAAELAIATAEHRSKVYAIPQIWTAEKVDYTEFDYIFKVRRKRHWHPSGRS